MTEVEWLGDRFVAQHLLDHLLKPGKIQRTKAGKRRLRLFACACCRAVWHLWDGPLLPQVIEATERFAEGLIERAELDAMLPGVRELSYGGHGPGTPGYQKRVAAGLVFDAARDNAASAAFYMTALPVSLAGEPDPLPDGEVRHLLREVFGNPFRPAALDRRCNTRIVLSLAQAAYDERLLPSGHLDNDRLAVLSDALDEAGASGDILAHLRSPGPHVRGCWALDLILGKS